jgi:hypothetical protein
MGEVRLPGGGGVELSNPISHFVVKNLAKAKKDA